MKKYILLLLPFIFFLASCGKKSDSEKDKPYIERIQSEDVSCYRTVHKRLFDYTHSKWKCTEQKSYVIRD